MVDRQPLRMVLPQLPRHLRAPLQARVTPARPARPVKSPAPGSLVSGATCLVSCVAARSWSCSLTGAYSLVLAAAREESAALSLSEATAALDKVCKKQRREGKPPREDTAGPAGPRGREGPYLGRTLPAP